MIKGDSVDVFVGVFGALLGSGTTVMGSSDGVFLDPLGFVLHRRD